MTAWLAVLNIVVCIFTECCLFSHMLFSVCVCVCVCVWSCNSFLRLDSFVWTELSMFCFLSPWMTLMTRPREPRDHYCLFLISLFLLICKCAAYKQTCQNVFTCPRQYLSMYFYTIMLLQDFSYFRCKHWHCNSQLKNDWQFRLWLTRQQWSSPICHFFSTFHSVASLF